MSDFEIFRRLLEDVRLAGTFPYIFHDSFRRMEKQVYPYIVLQLINASLDKKPAVKSVEDYDAENVKRTVEYKNSMSIQFDAISKVKGDSLEAAHASYEFIKTTARQDILKDGFGLQDNQSDIQDRGSYELNNDYIFRYGFDLVVNYRRELEEIVPKIAAYEFELKEN